MDAWLQNTHLYKRRCRVPISEAWWAQRLLVICKGDKRGKVRVSEAWQGCANLTHFTNMPEMGDHVVLLLNLSEIVKKLLFFLYEYDRHSADFQVFAIEQHATHRNALTTASNIPTLAAWLLDVDRGTSMQYLGIYLGIHVSIQKPRKPPFATT